MANNFFSGNIYGKRGQSAGTRATRKMFSLEEERKKKRQPQKKQALSKKTQPQAQKNTTANRGFWDRFINPKPKEKPVINRWLEALGKSHTEAVKQSGRRKLWNPEGGQQAGQQGKAAPTSKVDVSGQYKTGIYAKPGNKVKAQVGDVRLIEREGEVPLVTNRTLRQRKQDQGPAQVGGRKAYGPNASQALAASMTASGPSAELIKAASKAKRAKTELEAARKGIQTEASDWGWSPGDKRTGSTRQQQINRLQSKRQDLAEEGLFGGSMGETFSRLGQYKALGQQIQDKQQTARQMGVQRLRNKAQIQAQKMKGEQGMQQAKMRAQGDVWSSIIEGQQNQGMDTQQKFQAAQTIDKNLRGQMVPHPEKDGELISYDVLSPEQKQKVIRDQLKAILGGAGIFEGGQDPNDRLGIGARLEKAKQG